MNNSSELLRNALPVIGLLLGAILGWGLNASHNRRKRSTSQPSPRDRMEMHVDETQDAVHHAEVELAQLDVRANYLTKAIASMRQQIDDSEEEHDRLLATLDERQASVKDAQHNLQTIHKSLQTRTQESDRMLVDIDKSIEELDLLNQMKDGYVVKINRLTQQVQWQDSELRMLRQTMKAKSAEIEEARALLEQRDAELRLLIRQRQQREIDIEHARQVVAQRTDELRRQVGSSSSDPFTGERPPARLPAQRIDVTPSEPFEPPPPPPRSEPHRLPPAAAPVVPARPTPEPEVEDDLTVIPRLADFYARQLQDHGIRSIRQLAELSEAEVRAMLNIPAYHSPNIDGWLRAARKLTRKGRNERASGR